MEGKDEYFKWKVKMKGGDTYFDYKAAGAESVMSATGAMWNPLLAQEIKEKN